VHPNGIFNRPQKSGYHKSPTSPEGNFPHLLDKDSDIISMHGYERVSDCAFWCNTGFLMPERVGLMMQIFTGSLQA
jgi:hypothetical protein